MKNTPFEGTYPNWAGDMPAWLRANAETNDEQLSRLRRNLRLAREQELTPRQRQLLAMYYDQGLSMPQIAARLGINRSTVSRIIRRAKDRLYRCLRYGL